MEQRIRWRPGAVLFLCLLFYLWPMSVALAFLTAAGFHEFGHLAAAALLGGKVRYAELKAGGVVLAVSELTAGRELLCALAGPLFGLLLLPFGRIWPHIAMFALAQSMFNLLPIYPLDGGRCLFCLLRLLLGDSRKAESLTRTIGTAAGAALGLWLLWLGISQAFGLRFLAFGAVILSYGFRLWKFGLKRPAFPGTIEASFAVR